MELDDVLDWFSARDLPFQWRREPLVDDKQAILRPLNGATVALGALDVAIVIPDVHLGVGNDVFRTAAPDSPYPERLLRFLQSLSALRDQIGAEKFRVVQVGDWYDFYRAPGPTVDLQVSEIELQYGNICRAARSVPVLHCIGNHDAGLYRNPGATASRYGIAQPIGSNAVMAYHGHDSVTLETIEKEELGTAIGLNIVNLLALDPLLGGLVDFIQMVKDDSFQETWTKGNTGGDNPWHAASGHPQGWDAPWVARDDAAALVRAARGLEYVTDTGLQAIFVGHSHRPGIASAWITAERRIPIIDVGSWTYGRAEIAIVTPKGAGLAAIPIV